jgi:RHS repeat-associated protein
LTYGTHGRVPQSDQDHTDTVGAGSSHQTVQYAFDDAVDGSNVFTNALRLKMVTYPQTARKIHQTYGSSGSVADLLHRVDMVEADSGGSPGTDLTKYSYNGTSRLAATDYPVPDVIRRMFNVGGAGTNVYNGYDRFGRITKNYWYDYTSGDVQLDNIDYAYDAASNRLTRDIVNGLDHRFYYDGLHRLTQYEQGTLSGTTLGSRNWQATYTLDQLGNWSNLVMGNPNGFLIQARVHNKVNEIDVNDNHSDAAGESITASVGTNWANPTYDAAGNMTAMANPYSPASNLSLKYDAWNRLVEAKNGASLVQQNEFDGLGRRIVRSVYVSGSLDHRIRYYYNEAWQLLEERKEVSGTEDTDPLNQYVWHPYYIDALAIRWYDADTDNNLAENADGEYYSLHDANFNVALITYNNGAIAERYLYDPYGGVGVRTWNWAADSDNKSDFGQSHLFTGRELDLETYLQLNRHRFYASHLARWLTRDPIDYWGGTNLYAYVGGMPTYYVDPSGLEGLRDMFWMDADPVPPPVSERGRGKQQSDDLDANKFLDNLDEHGGTARGGFGRRNITGERADDIGQGALDLVPGAEQYQAWTGQKLIAEREVTAGEKSLAVIGALAAALPWDDILRNLGRLKKADAVPCPPKVPCFPAGTLVLMADGNAKPIDEVEPGDMVLADDPEDAEKPSAFRVIAVPQNWTKRLIHIDVDQDGDGDSDAHYRATGKHPFWTTERGWQYAVDLKSGDKLLADELTQVSVLNVSEEKIVSDTYNLSVEGVHTFYVVDRGIAVLVHNTQPPIGGTYRGDDEYIGQTNDFERRTGEWRRKGREIRPEFEIPDEETRLGVEQELIEENKRLGRGPKQRNAIDPNRTDAKAERMRQKGKEFLDKLQKTPC